MLLQMTFIGIAILTFLLFYLGTGKSKTVLIFGSIWLIVCGVLSYRGFFQNTSVLPPRMIWVLLPVLILVVLCYRTMNVLNLKINYLIAIHVLRLPVELVLFQLFLKGSIPVLMTFQGWNFDIFIGISAIAMLSYSMLAGKRLNIKIFRWWNILGLLFLFLIVSIAILSAPSPIQLLAFETPNIALITFPYTLLPAVIVPFVLLSHLLCLKCIRGKICD
ncbi:hypothetical protein [Pedobacter caeni]|uniref:Uncharacterized protein n=1 Tax=Pedobacter caeni TaxID=288992 RepID=A0A1M5GLZ9_9SPHI|nr:hypothetical protein [Pedobacter caeni]SHG04532.1 hypothetical protein SAMN04488522_104269 [Pedobacter caeni]